MGDVFTYVDYHFSPLSRIIQEKRGNVFYNPTQFGESEGWFESKLTDPDKIGTRLRELAVVRVAPMDKDGYFTSVCRMGFTLALLKTAKKCIVEICQGMPYCYGGARESIHISEVDYVIDEDSPMMEMPPAEPTEIDRQIAGHVLPYIS